MIELIRSFLESEDEAAPVDAPELVALFARFDRFSADELLAAGALVRRPSDELLAARATAAAALTATDRTILERGREALERYATRPGYAATLIAPAYFPGQWRTEDAPFDMEALRIEALPALIDALVATILGDRLDPATAELLLAVESIELTGGESGS